MRLFPLCFAAFPIVACTYVQNPNQDPPLRIGVLSLNLCFDPGRVDLVKELQSELTKMRTLFKVEINDINRELALRDANSDMLIGTPLRKKYLADKLQLESKRQYTEKLAKAELEDFYRAARIKVYDEVLAATAIVAREKELDLVLKEDTSSDLETEQGQIAAEARTMSCPVLYYAQEFDITQDVLCQMAESRWTKVLNERESSRETEAPK